MSLNPTHYAHPSSLLLNWVQSKKGIIIRNLCTSCLIPFLTVLINDLDRQPQANWFDIISSHQYLGYTFFSVSLALSLLGCFIHWLQQKQHSAALLNDEQIAKFLYTLTEGVSEKVERYQPLIGQDLTNIPKNILDPENQINLINQGIYDVYKMFMPDQNCTVRIALFDNILQTDYRIRPVKWLSSVPKQNYPKTDIQHLQQGSTLMHAAETGHLCIIEDIAQELQQPHPRFKQCHHGTKTGSIMCYPIQLHADTTKTVLVVSIYSPAPNQFQKHKKESYEWILDQFGARLRLESCLFYIKEQLD
tara:strand:- start:11104 stop:12018 length:915 start_codon:yes stop_codon:yes gene_type:complete